MHCRWPWNGYHIMTTRSAKISQTWFHEFLILSESRTIDVNSKQKCRQWKKKIFNKLPVKRSQGGSSMQPCPFLLNGRQDLHTRNAHDSRELLDLHLIGLEETAQPVGWGPQAWSSGALPDWVAHSFSLWASPTNAAVAPQQKKMDRDSNGTERMQNTYCWIVLGIWQARPARDPTSCGAWFDQGQPHPESKRHQRKGEEKKKETHPDSKEIRSSIDIGSKAFNISLSGFILLFPLVFSFTGMLLEMLDLVLQFRPVLLSQRFHPLRILFSQQFCLFYLPSQWFCIFCILLSQRFCPFCILLPQWFCFFRILLSQRFCPFCILLSQRFCPFCILLSQRFCPFCILLSQRFCIFHILLPL